MYCSIDDIISVMSENTLAMLTDDSLGKTVDDNIVLGAITQSSALIDDYLRGRYELPLSSEHDTLRKICIDLSRAYLYERRPRDLEKVKPIRGEALVLLKDIQSGKIVLNEGVSETRPKRRYYEEKTDIYNGKLENYLK